MLLTINMFCRINSNKLYLIIIYYRTLAIYNIYVHIMYQFTKRGQVNTNN